MMFCIIQTMTIASQTLFVLGYKTFRFSEEKRNASSLYKGRHAHLFRFQANQSFLLILNAVYMYSTCTRQVNVFLMELIPVHDLHEILIKSKYQDHCAGNLDCKDMQNVYIRCNLHVFHSLKNSLNIAMYIVFRNRPINKQFSKDSM
jgi:hypothetical protein